jgi:hypothetical protein
MTEKLRINHKVFGHLRKGLYARMKEVRLDPEIAAVDAAREILEMQGALEWLWDNFKIEGGKPV